MKKLLKVGIIGPTNMPKLSTLTHKPIDFFRKRAAIIGEILANANCELWVNSDQGMLVSISRAYGKANGKKCVVLVPEKGEPWPKAHTIPFTRFSNELRKEPNWFWSNYNVTAIPDICVCVGLSAGTLSELAYIKWNCQFECGNLKRLVVIKELIRDGKLPDEIECEVENILVYLNETKDLEGFLKTYEK